MTLPYSRRDIINVLQNPHDHKWRAHGIGFIKTYLDDAQTWRLNVYDRSLINTGISRMHDHPWSLQSYILAGRLTNTRYIEHEFTGTITMMQGIINCANFKGIEGEPYPVHLIPGQPEVYNPGETYYQRQDEIHQTDAMDGTVTVLQRGDFSVDGKAKVFWPVGREYGDASRQVEWDEIKDVCELALMQMMLQPVA